MGRRPWLRSFSNLDRSRSIQAKCSVFFIKPRSLRRIWQKSDLATPICAARHRCSLFTCKRRRGLRRSAQTRTRWPCPLRPERSVRSFSPDWIDLIWQIWIDLDRSRFEKERNPCVAEWSVVCLHVASWVQLQQNTPHMYKFKSTFIYTQTHKHTYYYN